MAELSPSPYDGPERRLGYSVVQQDSPVAVWARAIAVVGIPGAIACFLVYILAQEIPRIGREVSAGTVSVQSNTDLVRQHVAQQDELLRLVRWICANTAKDANERRNCFEN